MIGRVSPKQGPLEPVLYTTSPPVVLDFQFNEVAISAQVGCWRQGINKDICRGY
jgi:hypothetical protein